MKRHLLFVMLALFVAGTAMANPANSICVYFDAEGTTTDIGAGTAFPTYDAYIIIFVEDAVTGASYTVNMANSEIGAGLLFTGATYPEGLQIGDPFAGIEVGFTGTYYGFLGVPVLVSTMSFVNMDYPATPYESRLWLTPHPNYGELIYGDGEGAIKPLVTCAEAVADEETSFGNIKSMFR